jgi:hypothetical protein
MGLKKNLFLGTLYYNYSEFMGLIYLESGLSMETYILEIVS